MKLLKLLLLVTTFLSAGFDTVLQKDDFPPVEEAFKVSAVQKGDVIETKIILADKVHITADTLKYSIVKPKEISLNVAKPEAHEVDGDMLYEKDVLINIPVKTISSKVAGDYTLSISFSGCSDQGICYSPIDKQYTFKGDPNAKVGFFDKLGDALDESNPNGIVDLFMGESSLFIILLFLILGLLLALTPCIFPMIPILSSIIVSQSGEGKPSASKGFFISLIYVLSMAVTYTVVGVVSGLLGADIQSAMQNPWVLSTFALMFFALALSLFGYYEIQLPSKWQSKINSASDSAQGKGIIGTAIMGFLSAFIIGPCVAPPLAGAVIFISQTGDALLGGIALFAMSMGMGLPLLLVGVGAGKFMPRPGGWMTAVSETFGVVMLGLAIFMLGKVVSATITMTLWSLLFMGTAFYMGVFDSSSARSGMKKLFQLLAFVFLIYGASIFIGVLSGAKSILHPFANFTKATVVQGTVGSPAVVTHVEAQAGYSIEKLQKEVEASSKLVVVDFRKKSCASCDELEEFTFPDPAVQEELKRFTFITIDVTANTDEEKALQKHYGLFGTPSIIFFDKENNPLPTKTLAGFVPAKKFVKHLKTIN
ncbi:protein-disulfide reductase DsbD [bacterium]|nr:protein-disulfide reductase DsbD [bacterium]MBU1959464.1 protein-disulfide reductase DsbD [bacterium]